MVFAKFHPQQNHPTRQESHRESKKEASDSLGHSGAGTNSRIPQALVPPSLLGSSWCTTCRKAKPVVAANLRVAKGGVLFGPCGLIKGVLSLVVSHLSPPLSSSSLPFPSLLSPVTHDSYFPQDLTIEIHVNDAGLGDRALKSSPCLLNHFTHL